jgi:hypothetical protein
MEPLPLQVEKFGCISEKNLSSKISILNDGFHIVEIKDSVTAMISYGDMIAFRSTCGKYGDSSRSIPIPSEQWQPDD